MLLGEAYGKTGNADDARMQFEAARKTFAELGAGPAVEAVLVRLQALASTALDETHRSLGSKPAYGDQ